MSTPLVATPEFWRKCSSCKNSIGYKKTHYVCSVSTCTRKRTGYVFCSVHCWERHLPGARHRDAAAIEAMSPTFEEWRRELAEGGESETTKDTPNVSRASESSSSATSNEGRDPKRVIVRTPSASPGVAAVGMTPFAPTDEILVVVSKLKAYIRARSDMNTSDSVMDYLSKHLRRISDRAIESARSDGRKTVMDRDFEGLK